MNTITSLHRIKNSSGPLGWEYEIATRSEDGYEAFSSNRITDEDLMSHFDFLRTDVNYDQKLLKLKGMECPEYLLTMKETIKIF